MAAAKTKQSKDSATIQNSSSSIAKKNSVAEISSSGIPNNDDRLPPFVLQMGVLFFSGVLLIFCLRDFLTTGKNIAGPADEAYLLFTKSTDWFEDSHGWRSQQGGFSAVQQRSTDANNMGGLFVRKLAGAAGVGLQVCKVLPLLRQHDTTISYAAGHLRPFLWTTAIVDSSVLLFLWSYQTILREHGAWELPLVWCSVLALEILLVVGCLLTSLSTQKRHRPIAAAMPPGKTPRSLPSNIVARTVVIISSYTVITSLRDIFAPGRILSLWFYDDLYLEWTNAFYHSPPPEEEAHNDANAYIGDKFIAQLAAVYLLGLSLYKCVGSLGGVRWGTDGSGLMMAQHYFWQATAVGNVLLMIVLRVFTGAAASASWNVKFHVMAIGYELFILGLYGFM